MSTNFNKDKIQGKWTEIKGELQKAWGNITNDEWDKTQGDATAISGLIQQKYGGAKEKVSMSVSDLLSKYVSEPTKDKLKN
jgi:uncharacterized protein YjbJ (UPF0337 family)